MTCADDRKVRVWRLEDCTPGPLDPSNPYTVTEGKLGPERIRSPVKSYFPSSDTENVPPNLMPSSSQPRPAKRARSSRNKSSITDFFNPSSDL